MVRRTYLVAVITTMLILIFGSIFAGWNIVTGPVAFSFLGLILMLRTSIQIRRSRIHLREMREIYRWLLSALGRLYPNTFDEAAIRRWMYRPLNAEMWMQVLFKEHPYLAENWQAVVDETLRGIPYEAWLKAFPAADPALLRGDPVEFASKLMAAGIPVYGNEVEEIESTLDAIEAQSVPFDFVAVVLNDPGNLELEQAIPAWISRQPNRNRYEYIPLDIANKKAAMAAAATAARRKPDVEIWVNVDSDTKASPNALLFTLLAFVTFPQLHGITSNVRIKNLGDFWSSLLQYLTYFRYDSVNNVERAARRYNETVLSGPWLGVRLDTFSSFMDEWLNFTFAGKPVRPGDDRRITYLLNRLGLATAYIPSILVYTDCPTTIGRWIAQQSRWTLSYYVNMIDSFMTGQAWTLSLWSLLDQVYGGFFSFFLLGAVASVLVRAFRLWQAGDPMAGNLLIIYSLSILLVNFLRGAYSALTNRDLKGLIMTGYVYLFIRYLVPIKIMRPFNLIDQRWQGRKNVT